MKHSKNISSASYVTFNKFTLIIYCINSTAFGVDMLTKIRMFLLLLWQKDPGIKISATYQLSITMSLLRKLNLEGIMA